MQLGMIHSVYRQIADRPSLPEVSSRDNSPVGFNLKEDCSFIESVTLSKLVYNLSNDVEETKLWKELCFYLMAIIRPTKERPFLDIDEHLNKILYTHLPSNESDLNNPSPCDTSDSINSLLNSTLELLKDAGYRPVTQDMWNIARSSMFSFVYSVEIDWENINGSVIRKFVEDKKSDIYEEMDMPNKGDRALVFHRGRGHEYREGIFLLEKLDILCETIFAKGSKVRHPIHRGKRNDSYQLRALRETVRQKVKSRKLLSLFQTEKLQSQSIQWTVVMYQPNERSIVLRMYYGIPVPDMEAALPFRTVFLRPFDRIYFFIMLPVWIGALIFTIYTALTNSSSSVFTILIAVVLGLVGKIYSFGFTFYSITQQYSAEIWEWICRKRVGDGEQVIHLLIDQSTDSVVKDLLLVYFLIWSNKHSDEGLSEEELQLKMEHYVKEQFNVFSYDHTDTHTLNRLKAALRKLKELDMIGNEDNNKWKYLSSPNSFIEKYKKTFIS
eukprot:NODE_1968_length_1734_cov_36.486034_g1677_i0.p1 GENE.NODE_1968_length_1734_cov_36.486034_g1677_i0~~NODE_1968_length_1734_cov_36.486034_g1677_i0.p1  ORF type:complete len:515 (+),score=85.41 NODE_1968_length_1734_cov_36.486034_g1677_i0:57-1547(+)